MKMPFNDNMQSILKEAFQKSAPKGTNELAVFLTTECMIANVVDMVLQKCLDIAEPMPNSGDIDDIAREQICNEIREYFGVE